jgi:PAS domain S-box-containing protein
MMRAKSFVRRYVLPIAFVGLVVAIKLAGGISIGREAPSLLFGLAAIASGWAGGWRGVVLATVIGASATAYFFLPPHGSLAHTEHGWIRLTAFVIEGTAIAAIFAATDRARAARDAEAARKTVITDAALDGIVMVDRDGRIVDFNPAAERMFGRAKKDVLGQPFADAILPESMREPHRRGIAQLLASKGPAPPAERREFVGLHADGSELPVELTIVAAEVQGQTTFAIYLRDLSVRRTLEEDRARLLALEREARSRAEQAAARVQRLQQLTEGLTAAVTVHDVGRVAVEQAALMIGAEAGMLLQRQEDGSLDVIASIHVPDAAIRAVKQAPSGMTAEAIRTGQPQWASSAEEYAARYPDAASLATRVPGAMAVPLVSNEQVLGVLAFRFATPMTDPAERSLMLTFTAQTALALERALLFERERAGRERLEAIAALAARFETALHRAEVAEIVVEQGMRSAGSDTCTLYVLDEKETTLELIGDRGCVPEVLEKIRRIHRDSGSVVWRTLETRESLWVENDEQYAKLFPDLATLRAPGPRAHAFWSVPLLVEGRPIGLLGMGFYAPRTFSADDRAFVATFTRQCAQAVRRAQRLEREEAARRAAEQARSSLATTLHSIGDAVIATDTEGRITLMNPVAEALTGWSVDAAVGRPLAEVFRIVDEATRREVESPVGRVLREGMIVGLANHTVLLGKTPGDETPIDDSGAPIRDESGVIRGVVLVFRSARAEKRAEARRAFLAEAGEALGSSLDYRATLARVASLAVPRLGDWCAIHVKEEGEPGLQQIATAHFDPAKTELARELGLRYPPDPNATTGAPNVVRTGRSELYADIPEELLEAGAIDAEHLRIIRELRLRSALVVPIALGPVSAGYRVLGALTLIYAESGRRFTEDDVLFAEDFARRAAVAIENARLYGAEQRARDAADAANRAKDEFLATVSHELRTPLNAILGWARMLNAADVTGPRKERAALVVERNAVAMTQLIEDLLDVSRIVSGKMRLDVKVMNLAKVIDAAIDSLRPGANAKEIEIRRTLDPAATSFVGDAARLQQVVWNLLSNAVKFTPRGGKVDVALAREGSSVVLTVADNGKGIDASFLPFVFDPFRQADGSITRAHGGLGLGLAIARHLVELHGGRIEATSEGEGLGTTFTVRMPIAALAQTNAATSALDAADVRPWPTPPQLEGLKVLVVDDDDDARQLLQEILEACGSRVTTASSSAEAMSVFERQPPDVLLSDIGMPGEDGYALIRRVRALPVSRGGGVPAAALTAYARVEDRREVLSAGFMMHVPKPVEPEELVAVIASLARFSSRADT